MHAANVVLNEASVLLLEFTCERRHVATRLALVDEVISIMMTIDSLVRVVATRLTVSVNRIILHQQIVGACLEAHALLMTRSVITMLAENVCLQRGCRLLGRLAALANMTRLVVACDATAARTN